MWYVANELGLIQSPSSRKKFHSALSLLCCAPASTGLPFTWHCWAPIKWSSTQSFFSPNSVNTICTLLLSATLSSDSSVRHAARGHSPWFDSDFHSASKTCRDYCSPMCMNTYIFLTLTLTLWVRSAGMFEKRDPVFPGETTFSVTYSSSHSAHMGPLGHGEFKVRQTMSEGQEGYWGPWRHEQINPGDDYQAGCFSGIHILKRASSLTWTYFNGVWPPAKGGDTQCRRNTCRLTWTPFIHKCSDLLFHFTG